MEMKAYLIFIVPRLDKVVIGFGCDSLQEVQPTEEWQFPGPDQQNVHRWCPEFGNLPPKHLFIS